MLLIDLVMLFVTQEMLIASRAEKGRILMAALSTHLTPASSGAGNEWRFSNPAKIHPLMESASVLCFVAVSVEGQKLDKAGLGCLKQAAMDAMAWQAAKAGEERLKTSDLIRGIFWHQPGFLYLAAPLRVERKIVAGGCVLMSLDDIYGQIGAFPAHPSDLCTDQHDGFDHVGYLSFE